MHIAYYRVFIKYCVFSLKFWIFLNSASSAASASFLPALCVYTHWHRGRREKGQSLKYFKIFGKNTIFNEHPVCICQQLTLFMLQTELHFFLRTHMSETDYVLTYLGDGSFFFKYSEHLYNQSLSLLRPSFISSFFGSVTPSGWSISTNAIATS